MGSTRILAGFVVRKNARLKPGLKPGLVAGCAGLALLSACAGGGGNGDRYAGETTAYYLAHAAHNYNPPGPPGDPWGPYINIAAAHFDVPAMWIRQVMRVESGGHEYSGGQLIVSSAGAMGLMQLEPSTYQEMADRYGLGNDPFNPYDNIMAGTAYIHEMYQIYGSPGFLAAYNAGPGRLDSFINNHEPLPDETVNYVAMIAPNIDGYYPRRRSPADELAMNTEPMGRDGGILPNGFSPETPTAAQLSEPVEVASLAPATGTAATGANNNSAPAPVSIPISAILPAAAQSPPALAASVQAAPVLPPIPAPSPPRMPVGGQVQMASAIYMPNTQPSAPPQVQRAPMQAVRNSLPVPPPVPATHEYPMLASSTLPPAPAPHNFSLVAPALADTPVQTAAFNSGENSWGIQVGAYDSSSHAKAALGIAELTGASALMRAQPVVMTIHANGNIQYRARFVGLQHDEAVNACSRLSGGPTGCVVLSPDAQS